MLRSILAIAAGLITALVFVSLIQLANVWLHPTPPGFETTDADAMMEHLRNAPLGAMILVLVSYILGSYAGGLVAAFVANNRYLIHSILIGTVLMLFGFINLYQYPHPMWFVIISTVVYLPFAYLGGKTALTIKPKDRAEQI